VGLYGELFTQLLYPPSRVSHHDDPHGLYEQIKALEKVLEAPVWYDFELVEWRIRLGQILWGVTSEQFEEDNTTINNDVFPEAGTPKYWLLLQVLLSSELLLRLDAVTLNMDNGHERTEPEEIKRFDSIASSSIRWSLILARLWLENIQIEKTLSDSVEPEVSRGWMASLNLTTTTPKGKVVENSIYNVQWHGRHQQQQINGLLHFAQNLRWPNIETLHAKMKANNIMTLSDSHSMQTTPASTSAASQSPSYFSKRPVIRRGLSRSQSRISALISPSGWLSNSYLSGLVLPGEGMSHFLISTLLENDDEAVSHLGKSCCSNG
jgi:hypothetical protein